MKTLQQMISQVSSMKILICLMLASLPLLAQA
jgi:hypothetical protein